MTYKGHLIAARVNGAVMEENIFSQDAGLNQDAYKKVENADLKNNELSFTYKIYRNVR